MEQQEASENNNQDEREDIQESAGPGEETQASSENSKTKKEEEDFKTKFYYLAAELENQKKRYLREIESTQKFGNEKLLKSLIEVVDNFDRTVSAMKMAEANESVKNMLIGIEMVRNQFIEVLTKFGLTPIEAVGKKFDPNFHEAISEQVAEGKNEGDVIAEYQKGYMLNGRLLRASKVVLAKAK